MAENASVVSNADAAVEHGGSAAADPAGTEQRTPLTELLSDVNGAAGTWDLNVFDSDIEEYPYTWKGNELTSRKLKASRRFKAASRPVWSGGFPM